MPFSVLGHTGFFFLLRFIRALSWLGRDILRSNPAANWSEQGAAPAAWRRPWPWRSHLTSLVSLFLCLKRGLWILRSHVPSCSPTQCQGVEGVERLGKILAQSVFCDGAVIPLGIQPRSVPVPFSPSPAPRPAHSLLFFHLVWKPRPTSWGASVCWGASCGVLPTVLS